MGSYADKFEDEPQFTEAKSAALRDHLQEGFEPEVHQSEDNGPVSVGVYAGRTGMEKNLRVGKVKFLTSKEFDERRHVLVEVFEKCVNRSGERNNSNYNLWIAIQEDKYRPVNLNNSAIGKYCVVGFYINSLRDKEKSAVYNTHLSMRYFKLLDSLEEADKIAEHLRDHKTL